MVGMVIDPKGKYGTPIRPCTRTPMPGGFDHSTQATPPPATSCEPPEVRDVLRQELPAQSSRRGPGYSPVPWLSSGRKIVHRLLDRQHWAVGRVKNVGGRRVPLRAPQRSQSPRRRQAASVGCGNPLQCDGLRIPAILSQAAHW